jgi:hypothetical protein
LIFTQSLYEKPKPLLFVILSSAKNLVVLMNSGILHFDQMTLYDFSYTLSEKNQPSVNRFMRSILVCELFCFHDFFEPVLLPDFMLWYAASKAWIRSAFIL